MKSHQHEGKILFREVSNIMSVTNVKTVIAVSVAAIISNSTRLSLSQTVLTWQTNHNHPAGPVSNIWLYCLKLNKNLFKKWKSVDFYCKAFYKKIFLIYTRPYKIICNSLVFFTYWKKIYIFYKYLLCCHFDSALEFKWRTLSRT